MNLCLKLLNVLNEKELNIYFQMIFQKFNYLYF
jgi:hypothetical protein